MRNDDWADLAAQWTVSSVPDPVALRSRMRRYRLWSRISLASELLGTLLVLLLTAWMWPRQPDLRPWLIAACAVVVAWQLGYLLIRHRYRLFGLPAGGIVGMIDAETRRAKSLLATLWFGLAGGLLMVPLALMTIPVLHHQKILMGLMILAAVYVPCVVLRSWQLVRRIRDLRLERERLAG